MRIETNQINLAGIVFSLFWYAVYALALLLLSASRIWLALAPSKRMDVETQAKFTAVKNPLNYKTT